MVYLALDYFFVVFHTLLIVFNLLGWVWKPTRKANLATLMVTGLSWTFLGFFYGLGYCPLTDWHWSVLAELGNSPGTSSYVSYLLQRVLSVRISDSSANALTLATYLFALIFSIALNIRDYKWNRAGKK